MAGALKTSGSTDSLAGRPSRDAAGAEQAVLNLAESYGGWRELPSSPLAPQTGAGKAAPRMELVISLALPPNRQYGMEEIGGCLNIEAY